MRRLLKALLILVIGLPVLAAVGYWYLQQQIAQAGIRDLQLDIDRLTLTSVSFARVRFKLQQDGASHQIDLQNIDVSWHWQQTFKPALQQVTFGPGQIILARPTMQPAENIQTAYILPSQWQLPDWLPQHIGITDMNVLLPCATGQCLLLLNGYLSYHHKAVTTGQTETGNPAYWQSQLIISSNPVSAESEISKLVIDAHYQALPQPSLELTLQQSQQIGLSLKQHINPDSQLAVTELALALSPPSPANQALLQQWGIALPDAWLSQFQQPVQLYSKLNWQLPADGDLSKLLSNHDIDGILIARAPDPLFLPQLGLIQGELNAELSVKNQIVQRWQLNANGTVTDLVLPAAITDYGVTLNPVQFTLTSKATERLNHSALPLQLNLSSSGDNSFSLRSELSLNLSDNPKVDIAKANLTATIAKFSLQGNIFTATNLQLNTVLSGHWQADNWRLALADNSSIGGAVVAEVFSADNVKLIANNSSLTGNHTGLNEFNGELNVSITQFNQPALISQNWQWQSQLSGNPANMALEGELTNDSGLAISHQMRYQPAVKSLKLNWQMGETYLLAGNPLAATLSDWPALLTLNKGRLSASGDLTIAGNNISSDSQLQFGDIGGIYDRSLFTGLNANVGLKLADNQFELQTSNLQLNRLNHGFELGPLTLNATATIPLATPQHLTLSVQQAEMRAMNGTISVNSQQLDFSQPENQLVLQLQQIDLAALLRQHPSSDLTGNGKLSGTVPLTISAKGFSISDGSIAAEAPGGQLQYRSASTSAMANTNSSMKLVFEALDNFHYTVLSSDISYDTNGKLILGLKLHGSNPNMQQGRAINLNVNLEEDLPALITSLQLTNKLNDVITQRVQQYLKQQAAKAANGDKQ